jgi:cell division protein FtsW (lipid II flippase)
MPFSLRRRPELAGLDLRSRREVRRIAWHFAQRHWTLHAPAFVWIFFVLMHVRYHVVPERREYLMVTVVLFIVAVVNIRLHIARYLKAARAVFDQLGRDFPTR